MMIDVKWHNEEVLVENGEVFEKLMHALFGIYIWEFATSFSFDWDYMTGQRKFKWSMIFYFASRYFLLFALIGIGITVNALKPVNCQALYTYNQIFGNATIVLASINLSLRTMAVWSQAWYIVLPLVTAAILVQWSLLLHGILLKTEWISGEGCIITSTKNEALAAAFIYTVCLDFAVLMLAAVKLGMPPMLQGKESKVVRLILDDGLIFFIFAFVSNATATICMLLSLNAVMSIIANVPAAVAATVVSCRVVRRLTNYTTDSSAESFGTAPGSILVFREVEDRLQRCTTPSFICTQHLQSDENHGLTYHRYQVTEDT